jgi:hypothetical protein
MSEDHSGALFFEEQAFRQAWLWILMGGVTLLILGIFGYAFYQQLYSGIPWGNRPLSNAGLLAVGLSVIAIIVGTGVLLAAMRLRVWVEGDRLRVRFIPFVRKEIPLEAIARFEARTYRPLLEYGGWGIRWGGSKRGWAYTVSGNQGVNIELTDGKRFLVGSRRPVDLAEALARARGTG